MVKMRRLLVWIGLVLVLLAVTPVLAQGGEALPQVESTAPEDLDDIAVALMPLLVGAALIERTLEVIFTWIERTLLDATHTFNRFLTQVAGMVQVDFRDAWDDLNTLTNAMLRRKATSVQPYVGDSDSEDPDDWPLAMLEARLMETKNRLDQAEAVIERAIDSPEFVTRKKIAAAWMSSILGVLLALGANLRLFDPIGVEPPGSFAGTFDILDLIMAGLLMGMGTEWVHQVIGVLIKSKGALSRVGLASNSTGSQVDMEQVRMLAELAVQQELNAQSQRLRDELQIEISQPGDSPT